MRLVAAALLAVTLLVCPSCADKTPTASSQAQSQPQSQAAPTYTPATVNVTSFNVGRYVDSGNKEDFIERLKALNTDILGMCDNHAFYDTYTTILTEQSVLSKVFENCEMGIADSAKYMELCSLFSNGYAFEDVEVHEFKAKRAEDDAFKFIKAYTDIGGRRVCVISCQVHDKDRTDIDIRAAQYNELIRAVENEEFFIIMGSFNSFSGLRELGVFEDAGMNIANYGDNIFATTSNKRPLDNIIVSGNIVIEEAYCITDVPEDHYPLIAKLRFE